MKRSYLFLATILVLTGLAMSGCSTTSVSQSPESMELEKPVVRVCDLHDAGVAGDASLDAQGKTSAIADSAVLRNAFSTPDIYLPPAVAPGKRVCERHDDYVLVNPNLSPLAKKVALKRSETLVELLDAVKVPATPAPKPAAAPPNPAPAAPLPPVPPVTESQPSSRPALP